MRDAIDTIAEKNFSLISEHYVAGKADLLPDYAKEILDRWRDADRILMKFPKKSIAAQKLRAIYPDISIRQAYIDIDNACKFWNIHKPADKGFLQRFLIDFLTGGIVSNAVPDSTKAKYAATLERLQSSIEAEPIDPRLMEKNTINIQFNINKNNIIFSEKELNMIPKTIRQKLLNLTANDITEDQAAEILNS